MEQDVVYIQSVMETVAAMNRGGLGCWAYSAEEEQARRFFAAEMEKAGLVVRIDPAGNVIGRLAGAEKDAPAILTGGAIAAGPGEEGRSIAVALTAVRRLVREQGALRCPVEVVAFSAAAPGRFFRASLGSKAMLGMLSLGDTLTYKDDQGVSLSEAARQWGYEPQLASRMGEEIRAYIEVQVDSGRQLPQEAQVGVVEKFAGLARMKIRISGAGGHAGELEPSERRDALAAAAEITLELRELTADRFADGVSATVVRIAVAPGEVNRLPSHADLWLDVRGSEQEQLIEVVQEIKDLVSEIAEEQELVAAIDMLCVQQPVETAELLQKTLGSLCRDQGLKGLPILSRMERDAMNFAYRVPAALLLVPEQEGDKNALARGMRLLYDGLVKLGQ